MDYISTRFGGKRVYQVKFTLFGKSFDQEISCHIGQVGRKILELIEEQLNESLDIEENKTERAA